AGVRTRSGLEADQSPATLAEQTDSVERYIQKFDWSDFREERETRRPVKPEPSPIKSAAYQLEQLIRPPYQQPRGRRMDPILISPNSIQVRTGFGVVKKSANQQRPARPNQVFDNPTERPESDAIGAYFNVVTAVVPYRDQLEEYQRNLALSVGYNPERDQPIYHNWILERSQITDEGAIQKWELIGHRNAMLRSAARLQTRVGPDFVDEQYLHQKMTMPIPQIDVPDAKLEHLMRHDDIPQRIPAQQVEIVEQGPDPDPSIFDPIPGPDPLQPPLDAGPDRQRGPNQPMDGPYPGSSESRHQIADKLMFRFIDFKVQPGVKYVYRLKLRLDDPNDPLSHPAPRAKDLDITVQQRLLNRPDPPAQLVRALNVNHIFYRDTEFSDPSRVITTATGSRVLLDSVMVPTSRRGYVRAGLEATSHLVLADFDRSSASDLVANVRLIRGCVVNLTKTAFQVSRSDTPSQQIENPTPPRPSQQDGYSPDGDQRDFPDPSQDSNELERKSHRFDSSVLIMDMNAGRKLTESGIETPAEILVFQDGKMRVIRSDECADEISRFPPMPEE
ncbi:MAG: hypothetical protein AAF497_07325, partial [Planctomycetota bacterium]